MRSLTFKGFLKTYTHALSLHGSYGVSVLAREADAGNYRLRAPLFFLAVTMKQTAALVSNTTGDLRKEYEALSAFCNAENLEEVLRTSLSDFEEDYRKVWGAYLVRKNQHTTDDRMKENARKRIQSLREQKEVSVYRICKDLNLNVGNVNAWLLHGESKKISYDNATRVLKYLMQSDAPGPMPKSKEPLLSNI